MVQGSEHLLPAARQFFEGPGVKPFQQLPDGPVQFSQREELTMAQYGQYPAFDHLHPDFSLGLVKRRQLQPMVFVKSNLLRSHIHSIRCSGTALSC